MVVICTIYIPTRLRSRLDLLLCTYNLTMTLTFLKLESYLTFESSMIIIDIDFSSTLPTEKGVSFCFETICLLLSQQQHWFIIKF